jgi:hypothetical protein
MPLVFIVFITALKDIYEDYQRHRTDYNENNQIIQRGGLKTNFNETFSEVELAGYFIYLDESDRYPVTK